MTGTGTETDPYIVDNWEDFVTAVNASTSPYIEFDPNANNKTIDFNEVAPMGISSLSLYYHQINGNGWTLKNMYIPNYLFVTGNSNQGSAGNIKNLNFENFVHDGTVFSNVSSYYNCKFSGLTASSVFNYSSGSMCIDKCAFNLVCTAPTFDGLCNCGTSSAYSRSFSCNNVKLKINGASSSGSSYRGILGLLTPSYCLFNIDASNFTEFRHAIGNGNVFLGNIPTDITLYGTSSTVVSIFDKTNIAWTDSTYLKGCTPDQLKDSSYLASISFPIGVD